jgi:hypothetical protein
MRTFHWQHVAWLLPSMILLHATPGRAIPISGVSAGVSDKGGMVGTQSNISAKDQLELGLQYFNGPLLDFDAGLSKPLVLELKSTGLRIAYNRFLTGSSQSQGLFLQAGLNLHQMSGRSDIQLNDLSYQFSGLTITCRTCGSIRLISDQPPLYVIPSAGVGWQIRAGKKFLLKLHAGVQLYQPPKAIWTAPKHLPYFAKQEIKTAVRRINQDIQAAGVVFPTASLQVTYLF